MNTVLELINSDIFPLFGINKVEGRPLPGDLSGTMATGIILSLNLTMTRSLQFAVRILTNFLTSFEQVRKQCLASQPQMVKYSKVHDVRFSE